MIDLEQALEATRAPLPPALRTRVLKAAGRLPFFWFAAAAAAAAAVLLGVSGSASLRSPAAAFDQPDPCAWARALNQLCEEKR